MQIPKIPLFHSQAASLSTSRMTNEELKKKVNNHGYVLPENSYQFKYPVCTNTHLNNSSPKPFMKAGGLIHYNYYHQIFEIMINFFIRACCYFCQSKTSEES